MGIMDEVLIQKEYRDLEKKRRDSHKRDTFSGLFPIASSMRSFLVLSTARLWSTKPIAMIQA